LKLLKNKWVLVVAGVLVLAGAAAVWHSGLLGGKAVAKTGDQAKTSSNKGGDKDKKDPVPLEFVQREVVQPTLARLPGLVEFSGPLVAPQTALVRAKAAGTLLTLEVAEGSRVRAGQVIGRIELAELATRVAERSAMLESARTALAQAERTHASNQSLAAQQFISGIALDSSRAARL
jgi:membrane fusion protein, multidrug efflux system